MSSMITTSAWVPRGFAAPFPTKYKFDEQEFERIAELAKLQLDDANEDLEEAQEEEEAKEKEENKENKAKKNTNTNDSSKDKAPTAQKDEPEE